MMLKWASWFRSSMGNFFFFFMFNRPKIFFLRIKELFYLIFKMSFFIVVVVIVAEFYNNENKRLNFEIKLNKHRMSYYLSIDIIELRFKNLILI
jgi:hypothetical protein